MRGRAQIGEQMARLVNGWIDAEVADQLLGRGKSVDRADRRLDPDGDRHGDPGNAQKPLTIVIFQGEAGQLLLDDRQTLSQAIEFPRAPFDLSSLIGW